MPITRRDVARYVFLPGIVPRVRDALRTPFTFLALLFAQTFDMVRLLPKNHPYLRPGQAGEFGVVDVLRAGSAHLVFDRQHIDRVLMYFAVLAAWVVFMLMFVTACLYAVITPATAAMPDDYPGLLANIYEYTKTLKPEKDIALSLLDRTLGIKGSELSGTFFGSAVPTTCVSGNAGGGIPCAAPPFPSAFHMAMHGLLGFYAWAVFCFAVLFLIYLVSTVIIETSIKGKPFGTRMNTFWTPLRVVAGVGMLVPLAPHGLNTAQYFVLYTAKIGSAFATNAWLYYDQKLEMHMGVDKKNPMGMPIAFNWSNDIDPAIANSTPLAAKLNPPDMGDIVRFLHTVASCEYYYEVTSGKGAAQFNVQGYFYRTGKVPKPAYTEPAGAGGGFNFLPYADALDYFDRGNIRIIFGVYDENKYKDMGGLKPLCGEMVIPVTSLDNPNTPAIENPGAARAHEFYYRYLMILWDKSIYQRQLMDGYARQMVGAYAKTGAGTGCTYDTDGDGFQNDPLSNNNLPELGPCWDDPVSAYIQYQIETFQTIFQALINDSNVQIANPVNFTHGTELLDYGWAGAGIWYQKIAKVNGAYVLAVQQIPYGSRFPVAMENARNISAMVRKNISDPKNMMSLPSDTGKGLAESDMELVTALNQIERHLNNGNAAYAFRPSQTSNEVGVSGQKGYPINKTDTLQPNVILSSIQKVLGTDFLFSFRDNANVHPLTQLVTFGRTLLERSARQMLTGSAIASAGGVISVGNQDISGALRKISAFYLIIASVFFSAGFMLFYILPLMPFVYFFFAVLSWVKAVFEGLIGAPLWAMAHIRLEGNGFPSGAARRGYLLLMEIFLRPIVTVFALVAAIGIYSGMVYFLNDTLNFVLHVMGRRGLSEMVGGGETIGGIQGLIDMFFFTIMYIMLVYMLATSCFKIIDKIPNQFMRWFGQSEKSFAQITMTRDGGAGNFASSTYVTVNYPVTGLITKIDDAVYDVSSASAKAMDTQQGGALRTMIQRTLGMDRDTTIQKTLGDELGGMTRESFRDASKAARYEQAAKTAKEQAEKETDPVQKADLYARAKKFENDAVEAKLMAEINDPELLLREMINPGKSGMSAEAVSRANTEGKFRDLSETIKKVSPMTWDLLQSQAESGAKTGVYIENEQVLGNLMSRVRALKDNIRRGK